MKYIGPQQDPSEDTWDQEDFLKRTHYELEDLASHVRSKEVPYGPHVAPAGNIRTEQASYKLLQLQNMRMCVCVCMHVYVCVCLFVCMCPCVIYALRRLPINSLNYHVA